MTRSQENRIDLLLLAARHISDCDGTPELREQIKAEVHEWPQDLIIETLLDAGAVALHLLITNKKLIK